MCLQKDGPVCYLTAHSGLLQQVLLNLGPLNGASLIKVDVDVLPKAARIVIPDGLGIPKSWRPERYDQN